MSGQLVLPGFQHLPVATDNLFLACVPPAATVRLLGDLTRHLRKEHRLRGRPLAPSCLHVSLHGLGVHPGLPSGLIDAVSTAASSVAVPPFDVGFDRALSFANKRAARPFVLRASRNIPALQTFHRVLGDMMTREGLGRWVIRHFTPHMTLLYDRQLVEERAIEAVGWTVTEFVLVHSFVGQGRHVHLARWPLRG